MVDIYSLIALDTLRRNVSPEPQADPLADPLNRPEWRGLTWIFERRRRRQDAAASHEIAGAEPNIGLQ